MSTSVLIVTFGHGDEIGDCLDGVAVQLNSDVAEVIVVDNASTDATAEIAEDHAVHPIVIRMPENAGFATGMNTASERATGDHLLLLNPDCVMDPSCLSTLRRHLDDEPRAGAAAALLRNPDGSLQPFARRELSLTDAAFAMTFVGRIIDTKYRRRASERKRRYEDEFTTWPQRDVVEVDSPAGACVLIRRGDAPTPLMDAGLPLFYNDNDLYRRLRDRGLRVDVVPAATAVHGYGTSLRRADGAKVRAEMVRSMRDYQRRVWSRARMVVLHLVLVVDVVSAYAYGRLKGSREALAHARGTAGGLGLPGGEPLLFPRHSGRRRSMRAKSSSS